MVNGEALLPAGERYEVLKTLGQGAYGIVALARDRELIEKVAIKFISRTEVAKHVKHVRREVVNHSSLLHPHVIGFKRCILTDKYLGIVMEYASGGNLFDHVSKGKGLSEKDARWFFKQLMLALDYCHKMGVSNRDVKLENTLLESQLGRRPMLKLCDFGLSINEGQSVAKSMEVGTPGYCAPELLMRTNLTTSYDGKKADVWSSGVMLYTMLCCQYPFDDALDAKLSEKSAQMRFRQRALQGKYSFPSHVALSGEAKDLISRMLKDKPLVNLDEVNAAYLKLSRTASTEESMRLLDSISHDGSRPSWASAAGYHPEDGDEFGHLVDEIEDEEL
ncbi:hypothetical protein WJX81_006021 [Elliptochloris bilobata]|uniref:Protein kinase domain-containing protein n=1 Tax=Elliptochloris bilobata TaxID=381761 RepID=A0AAW1QJG8_9CHLO